MIHMILKVNKGILYRDVEKITSYTGAKAQEAGVEGAYDRIRTTDSNSEVLERFWHDTCSEVTGRLSHYVRRDGGYQPPSHGTDPSDCYEIGLSLPDNFNRPLDGSLEAALHGYFVDSLCARWFAMTDKEDAAVYAASAGEKMGDILRKLHSRVRPVRNTY